MDYPKFIVSNQKEESISIQMVDKEGNDKNQLLSIYSSHLSKITFFLKLSLVAQSVVSLTADAGIASLIPAWSHTFVGIDREIISYHMFGCEIRKIIQ